MNDDYKIFIWLLCLVVVLPLIGMALDDWHKKDCRIELDKVGKSAQEIKEICR